MERKSDMPSLLIRRALQYVKAIKRRDAEYAAEVDAWYRSGDGRSPKWITDISPDGEPYQINVGGKGYRFPHCPHGMSLWTDYDNICGQCEDSISVYAEALIYAHNDYAKMSERMDWLMSMYVKLPEDLKESLMNWATEPMRREI
jgi:hypothetical protein